ncbi:hypothetical protein [Mesorhizobium escarrei]|nr:hypothetical protein [Mesorhizobium escarrei]
MTGRINSYKDHIVWEQAMDLARDQAYQVLLSTKGIGKMLRHLLANSPE